MSAGSNSFFSKLGRMFQGETFGGCTVEAAVCSDIGRRRGNNEDNFLFATEWNQNSGEHQEYSDVIPLSEKRWTVFGVFDGMGGGEKGEVASAMTSQIIRDTSLRWEKGTPSAQVCMDMRQAFLAANNQIVGMRQESGMYGTTGSVLVTNGEFARFFHLGDSRIYCQKGTRLRQLTWDQTLANMKIQAGFYTPDDPLVEKEKHYLTEFIGCDTTMRGLKPMESDWFRIEDHDVFMLCSDGLYDMVDDEQIAAILAEEEDADLIAAYLVEAANKNGGIDNITCMVLQF